MKVAYTIYEHGEMFFKFEQYEIPTRKGGVNKGWFVEQVNENGTIGNHKLAFREKTKSSAIKELMRRLKADSVLVDCEFELLVDFHEYKKGDIFASHGGLVSGINSVTYESISFDNKKYFKPVNPHYVKKNI